MYVCMYVCMYVFILGKENEQLFAREILRRSGTPRSCVYVCVCVCMCACMYVHMYVCMYVCIYEGMCVFMNESL